MPTAEAIRYIENTDVHVVAFDDGVSTLCGLSIDDDANSLMRTRKTVVTCRQCAQIVKLLHDVKLTRNSEEKTHTERKRNAGTKSQ